MTQLEEAGNPPRPDLSGNRMCCLSVICLDQPRLCEQDTLTSAFQENAPCSLGAQSLGIPIQEAAVSLGRKLCVIHSCGFPGPAQVQPGSRRLRGRCGVGRLLSGCQLLSLLGSWLGEGVPGGHAASLVPGFRVTTCKRIGLVGSSVLLDLNCVLLEPLLDF